MLLDFVGNKDILIQLEKNLKSKDLSHAYLFVGNEGLGKFTVARAFASKILEPSRDSLNYKEDYEHPDLKIVRSDSSVKKSQIEELIQEASMKPYMADYKVFIIDGFDDVTISGQNSLLKTLEEPEDYLKIILIASSTDNILPTILSRSRIIKFKDIPEEDIKEFLVNKEGINEKNAILFSKLSVGSVKRAINYSNNPMYLSLRNESIEVLDRLINLKGAYFREIDFFKRNKGYIKEIFNIFIIFLRDLVFVKSNLGEEYLINIDKLTYLNKQTISIDRSLKIIENIIEAEKLLKRNINAELTIEQLLIQIGGNL